MTIAALAALGALATAQGADRAQLRASCNHLNDMHSGPYLKPAQLNSAPPLHDLHGHVAQEYWGISGLGAVGMILSQRGEGQKIGLGHLTHSPSATIGAGGSPLKWYQQLLQRSAHPNGGGCGYPPAAFHSPKAHQHHLAGPGLDRDVAAAELLHDFSRSPIKSRGRQQGYSHSRIAGRPFKFEGSMMEHGGGALGDSPTVFSKLSGNRLGVQPQQPGPTFSPSQFFGDALTSRNRQVSQRKSRRGCLARGEPDSVRCAGGCKPWQFLLPP